MKLITYNRSHKARWHQHRRQYLACNACSLCETRTKVVLFRGSLPCEILFLGEAPGQSEDALGYPFIGPAGKLLDQIVEDAQEKGSPPFRFGISNVVGCIPIEPEEGTSGTIRQPNLMEMSACLPRLQGLINLVLPKLVCCLGAVAAKFLPIIHKHRTSKAQLPSIQLIHPAAMLRQQGQQQALSYRQAVLTLQKAIRKLRKS